MLVHTMICHATFQPSCFFFHYLLKETSVFIYLFIFAQRGKLQGKSKKFIFAQRDELGLTLNLSAVRSAGVLDGKFSSTLVLVGKLQKGLREVV